MALVEIGAADGLMLPNGPVTTILRGDDIDTMTVSEQLTPSAFMVAGTMRSGVDFAFVCSSSAAAQALYAKIRAAM